MIRIIIYKCHTSATWRCSRLTAPCPPWTSSSRWRTPTCFHFHRYWTFHPAFNHHETLQAGGWQPPPSFENLFALSPILNSSSCFWSRNVFAEANQGMVADVCQRRERRAHVAGKGQSLVTWESQYFFCTQTKTTLRKLVHWYFLGYLYLYLYKYQCSSWQVEAELILMTGEEAEKQPAGLGREDPNALEKPTWVDLVGDNTIKG